MTYDINNLDKFDEEFLKIGGDRYIVVESYGEAFKDTITRLKSFILQDRQEAYNAGRQSVIEEIYKDKRLMSCYEGCSCRERLLNKLKQ